jgi:hypothetical protein
MSILSKSRLMAFRQCPKRLWLEVHQPELREDSSASEASFATGHEVGAVARSVYDIDGTGAVLDVQALTLNGLMKATRDLLKVRRRIFEAGFTIGSKDRGERVIADILEPASDGRSWHMVEVKSSTSVKDYYLDDAAIQYHVTTGAGVRLASLHVAHLDSDWVYSGGDDYQGLFIEQDVTELAKARRSEVKRWIDEAHKIVAQAEAPALAIGGHCDAPYPCGFAGHCGNEHEAQHGAVQHPITWLPRLGSNKRIAAHIESTGARSMGEVPDELLNPKQLRVKHQTLSGRSWFDRRGAAEELGHHRLPALFLDFETVNFAVPRWAGTRPYEQIPFQFSVHRLGRRGKLEHAGYLDISGNDPRPPFAKALLDACGTTQPIFVYNRAFEAARIQALADAMPTMRRPLLAIADRLVDLLPVASKFYYHPDQQGSWSIKKVLPTIAPELSYDTLELVQDGGGAQLAYQEAIAPETLPQRRSELRKSLLRYCRLDTFAMVRLWAYFAGQSKLVSRTDDAISIQVGVGST